MKRSLIFFLVAIVCIPSFAQTSTPIIIPLWPDGAPNDNGIVTEEGHPTPRSVDNVSKPELWVFPAFRLNGTVIIACSADDSIVPFDDSIKYFKELQTYRIPSVLHIYPTGGHGWCEGPWFHYSREWKMELERWLSEW